MRLNQQILVFFVLSTVVQGCFLKPSGGRKDNDDPASENAEASIPEVPGPEVPAAGPGNGTTPPATAKPGPAKPTVDPSGFSLNQSLRFKPVDIMEAEISDALDLPVEDICSEAGGKSCTGEVHLLTLGGVDAYQGGVFVPIAESMIATPIVWERVILSACSRRAEIDFSGAAGVIFTGLPVDAAGNLKNVEDPAVLKSIDRLYQRILKRLPIPAEAAGVKEFYGKVSGKTPGDAAREWARLTCYAVLTSVEFVFY